MRETTASAVSTTRAKRHYATPTLLAFGKVRDLTNAAGLSAKDDGNNCVSGSNMGKMIGVGTGPCTP